MNWILAAQAKPLAAYGLEGSGEPFLSEDVLLYFGPPDGRGCIAIGSYDHHEDEWTVNKGFDGAFVVDGDPSHWMPLPELPK